MKRLLAGLFLGLALVATATAQSSAVSLEGQVVCCAECWAQADRTKVEFGTAEDLLKSQSCVAGGDPTLLAVREGDKFTLYQLAPAKFSPGKNWLEFIGKHVAVSGTVQKKKDQSVFRVDTLKVVRVSLAEQEAAKVIGTAVDLSLKDLFGNSQGLSSLNGRIVVLNFWATYCIPCRAEMPDLAAIQNEYAALGVQVVGASTDEMKDRAKVLQFVKETKVNFPIWMGATTADMMRFGLGGALPGTVVIARDGRVAKVISGVINPASLRKQIDAMLNASEPSTASGPAEERKPATAVEERPTEAHVASSVPS